MLLNPISGIQRRGEFPRRYRRWIALALGAALMAACGPKGGAPGRPDLARPGVDAGYGADGWLRLVWVDWTLAPGDEQFLGTSFQIDRERHVSAIRAVAPLGTHHIILYGPGAVLSDLFVSVVGTDELRFPPGAELRLRAGDNDAMQAHVLNASARPLSGTSAVEVLESDARSGTGVEANLLSAAILSLDLPPGKTTTAKGRCTLTNDQTLFAIAPHMHRLGVHHRATLQHDGQSTTLFDGDFDFDAQRYVPLGTIAAHAGDVIAFECTWKNTTSQAVNWGNYASAEMCTALIYRYPAGDSDFCTK